MANTHLGGLKIAARRAGVSLDEFMRRVDSGEKWCCACKKWQKVGEFYSDASRYDGFASSCKKAQSERGKRRYKPKGRTSKLGCFFVATRPGDKKQARCRVNNLIKNGGLPHPRTLPCKDCGHVWTEGGSPHQYDHHLGYSEEHTFSVEAVCAKCHGRRTRERGELIQKRGDKGLFVRKGDG